MNDYPKTLEDLGCSKRGVCWGWQKLTEVSSIQALRALCWLPVMCRVIFKILTVVFTCTYTESKILAHMKALVLNGGPHRGLGRARKTFHIPKTNCKTYGDRSLAVAEGRLWNSLPERITNSQDLPQGS